MAAVRISDIVVPVIFNKQVQLETTVKSNLLNSGAVVLDPELSAALKNPTSTTFSVSRFDDLKDDDANVSNDDPTSKSTPFKIGSIKEIQVALRRNNSWSSMDLAATLNNHGDPIGAIVARVAAYWDRQRQKAIIATMKGVFADNAAAPTGSEHVQNDLTFDASGASFGDNITNFTTESYINATATMEDESDTLALMFVHPVVYARMRKLMLIDFIPDSINPQAAKIPTFQGARVVQDKAMPSPSTGVFESWLFGNGAIRIGMATPANAVETKRDPDAGNGAGQDTLYHRQDWCIHPVGHKFTVSASGGGPDNTATSGNLAHVDSWARVFPERNQIPFARLITREY